MICVSDGTEGLRTKKITRQSVMHLAGEFAI